ncbi:hypothetical protein L1275_000114 [Flavobacterium sp. HSC-61S13]|nr:hypothetical protein [Flavobacterium sp. HSC-61S13]
MISLKKPIIINIVFIIKLIYEKTDPPYLHVHYCFFLVLQRIKILKKVIKNNRPQIMKIIFCLSNTIIQMKSKRMIS